MADEIQISELELAEELLQDMVLPVETATDTKAATLLQLKKWLGSSLPVGFIIPAVGRIEDSRFTLLDGKTLAKEGTYRDFYNKVVEQVQLGNWFSCTQEEYNNEIATYGQCGRFVIETDYVRIPTITRYIGATVTLSEFGQAFNESLPNIKGENNYLVTNNAVSGAFFTNTSKNGNTAYLNNVNGTLGFDASRSSSTYQDGAKVNVEHIKYPYYMVISTEGQTTPISVDINRVYEDINLKANKDLSNTPSNIDYVVESYGPDEDDWWYRVYKSGWVEQGGRITLTGDRTVNFLKPFKENNYTVLRTNASQDSGSTSLRVEAVHNITPTSFMMYVISTASPVLWYATGQGV